MSSTDLDGCVRGVLASARPEARRAGRSDLDRELGAVEARLDEPLRVAVTGPPNAGTSTLLDALQRAGPVRGSGPMRLAEPHGLGGAADAVAYVLRHVHADDARVLDAFDPWAGSIASPALGVAVLSRIDEIAGGRVDALAVGQRVAERYGAHPAVRRRCRTVLPVAGLLAQAATTLTDGDAALLRALARDPEGAAGLLASADRFGQQPERAGLLVRFGIHGVRVAVGVLATERDLPLTSLAAELRRRSGLDELRATLAADFAARADLLKACTALAAIEELGATLAAEPVGRFLLGEAGRVRATADELQELAVVADLREGVVNLDDEAAAEAERIAGGHGHPAAERLGLPVEASPTEVRDALLAALERWRRRAEHPLAARSVADASRVVARSLERMLAATCF